MLFRAFLVDRAERGVTQKTLDWYELYVGAWLKAKEPDALRASLSAFLGKFKSQTAKSIFAAVKAYETFAASLQGETSWIASFKRRFDPPPVYPVLSQGEFDSILSRLGLEVWEQRDRVMLSVLWYTGARLDAIRLLKPSDVDLGNSRLHIATKGGVKAPVCLPEVVMDLLRDWMGRIHGAWVFPSNRWPGRPICKSHLQHKIKTLAHEAGISKRVWIHGLRHSAITLWVNAGMPIEDAQKQALHRSIQTTMRYIQIADRRVKEYLDAVYK